MAAVLARAAPHVAGGPDAPASVLGASKERRETGRGVEPRPAEPVDRSVAIDQRRGLTVANERVVFDAMRS